MLCVGLLGAWDARALTDGTDQFCDCVQNTDGAGNDVGSYANTSCQTQAIPKQPTATFCEDWEAPSLYVGATDFGEGSPNYGPWYDYTDGIHSGKRGNNSYLVKTYGNGDGNTLWDDGEPGGIEGAAVRNGFACDVGSAGGGVGAGNCVGAPEYCSAVQGAVVDGGGINCWGTSGSSTDGNINSCIDVMRTGDFTSEDDAGTMPLLPDGSRGIYGTQAFAMRAKAGTCGFLTNSFASFGGSNVIGLTFKVAYSDNFDTAETVSGGYSIWDNAVKHNEVGSKGHGWPMFGQRGSGGCDADDDPFCWVIWLEGSDICSSAEAQFTINGGNGSKVCTAGGNNSIVLKPSNFTGSTDLPSKNKWMCVRAKLDGLTSTDLRMWSKVTIGSASEVTLIDVTVAGRAATVDPFTGADWRPEQYSNTIGAYGALNQAVRRLEDDIVVVPGEPVSCADAGFAGGGGGGGSPTYAPVFGP